MTPPSSSKVEELVRRLHHEQCDSFSCASGGMTKRCRTVRDIRSAVLAALELAAEECEVMAMLYQDATNPEAEEACRSCADEVRSLSIPSEKPREEP